MTDPNRNSPGDIEEQVERLEEDADALDRSDRAIPLPDETGGEDDEGVGPVTGVVP
jgi:hypothetical protein